MSGKLYEELAKHSGEKSDLLEARDIYGRIIKRYPSSRYQNKAALRLRNLSAAKKKQTQKQTVPKKYVNTSTQSAADKYNEGESCHRNLQQDSSKLKYRHILRQLPC